MKELIKSFGNRDTYYQYSKYIQPHVLSKEHNTVFKDLGPYYEGHKSVTDIDWDSFTTWFFTVQHPMFDAVKADLHRKTLTAIANSNEAEADEIIQTFITRDFGTRIAEEALKLADGSGDDLDPVVELIHDYDAVAKKAGATEEVDVTFDFAQLTADVYGDGGLNWRSKYLNKSVGPLRKGNFVIFGARFETGKTTWMTSEVTALAQDLPDDTPVLWINNEESGKAVALRIIQAALQRRTQDIMVNPNKAQDDYVKLLGRQDKIVVKDKSDASVYDVDRWCEELKPGLIVFDQLWKVHGFEKVAGNEVGRQAKLFAWAREKAKQYGPTITVHQADGSAEGQPWLDGGQLYGSKTAAQGEADVLIMMGKSNTPGEELQRHMSIVKNKLPGSKHTDPALRQGKFIITIVPELAMFKGVDV